MHITKNTLLEWQHELPVVTDIFYDEDSEAQPVVIYAHGINGFKDWGNFDLIAKQFAEAGFTFVKFNFSHNGTSAEEPEAFVNLTAYAKDNYTIQLDDIATVIDWVSSPENEHATAIDPTRIYLIGHSKGGAMVLLKAAEDDRVKVVATWAATSACKTPWGNWDKQKMLEWEHSGVQYMTNGRTKQELPIYYQLYQNYKKHEQRFDVERAIKSLQIPVLICHGTQDPAVPVTQAEQLHQWQPNAELYTVASDHVFGRKHPWKEKYLPKPMQDVLNKTIYFLQHNK